MPNKPVVLVAGIGGASLGTEIAKALRLAGRYRILGCDISPLAYGHYDGHFDATVIVDRQAYVENLLDICTRHHVDCVVPGAEEPTALIARSAGQFRQAGVKLAMNDPGLVERMSDKQQCFATLSSLGFRVPQTTLVDQSDSLDGFPMPCVIKPTTGSGGSSFVFFAHHRDEAELYSTHLKANGRRPLAQEYLSVDDGEFTVGVLSLLNGSVTGTIAMRRTFNNKLSIAAQGPDFLISSGYSQGLIDDFPPVCETAQRIAERLGSIGPINVQGRLCDDTFIPFEINPRFSATTYLRALAGFNEIDAYMDHLINATEPLSLTVRPGWYLRSLCEVAVAKEEVQS
ncbi:MAG: ATP-grasp domain-containing protein [Alphaproteobacteria bacterium]